APHTPEGTKQRAKMLRSPPWSAACPQPFAPTTAFTLRDSVELLRVLLCHGLAGSIKAMLIFAAAVATAPIATLLIATVDKPAAAHPRASRYEMRPHQTARKSRRRRLRCGDLRLSPAPFRRRSKLLVRIRMSLIFRLGLLALCH